ncbi:MAG: NAD(P)H-dependent oxidoreductase [Thermoplasmatales archaeon]
MKFLLISGSLRKDSYNTKLIRHIARKFLNDHEYEIADISKFPIYMEDTDVVPEAIENFKEQIRKAQIIIISTPEYNWSTSAALKNAIDWASRPPKDSAWKGKIVIIMSASTGMLGGARAQYHLRQILTSVDAILVSKPEIFISFAQEKFQDDELKDEFANNLIRDAIENGIKLYQIHHKDA